MSGDRRVKAGVCAALLACAAASPVLAQEMVPAGTRGELSVEYLYESEGSHRQSGGYDPIVWRARRTASLTAEVFAIAPQPLPAIHTMSEPDQGGLMGRIRSQVDRASSMAERISPSIQGAMAIAERCGDDEACMEREAMAMGERMRGDGQLEAMQGAQAEMAGMGQFGGRYQYWGGNFGAGTYRIVERSDIVNADPICRENPGSRCTREEIREGEGALPAATEGMAAFPTNGPGILTGAEWDSATNTLAVQLPVPLLTPYTETIVSDEPDGTYSVPIIRDPQAKVLNFPVAVDGSTKVEPLVVRVRGDWRRQSGEEVIMIRGDRQNGGKLTIRWTFNGR